MKTFLLAVISAVIAVACGAPASDSQFPLNWHNADAGVNDFYEVIKTVANAIKSKNVPITDNIDWARVEVLGEQFKNIFKNATETIEKIGLEINSEVGDKIVEVANRTGHGIDEILTEMMSDIKNQTLNLEDFVEYAGETGIGFTFFRLQIEQYLPDVADDVAKNIQNVINRTNNTARLIILQLIGILGMELAIL